MNPEKYKNLEAKLQAIKDLKAERYIGTQHAWEYLKAISKVYTNPKKVSDTINQSLKEKLAREQPYYPATPERVIGLSYVVGKLFEELEEDEDERIKSSYNPKTSNKVEDILYLIEFRDLIAQEKGYSDWDELILKEYPLRDISCQSIFVPHTDTDDTARSRILLGDYEIAALDRLAYIFLQNQEHEMTDELFGNNVLEYIREDYLFIFPEQARIIIETIASNTNFNYIFSKENFKKLRTDAISKCFSIISISGRIGKVIRDQVENKVEIRREIISDLFFNRGYASYEQALYITKEELKEAKKGLNNLINSNTPEFIIHTVAHMVIIREYIIRCLVSERNFIEKLLREGKKD